MHGPLKVKFVHHKIIKHFDRIFFRKMKKGDGKRGNILVGSDVVKAINAMCKPAYSNSSGNTAECQTKQSYTSSLLVVTDEGISDRKFECQSNNHGPHHTPSSVLCRINGSLWLFLFF